MGKIAFVFAGQGAQYPSMGKDIYDSVPECRYIFDSAEKLKNGICDLMFNGPAEKLSVTLNTQPALFTVDYACAELLRLKGIVPDAVAGFSLGEIPALTFSGALSFDDGMALVMKRAEFMQAASERHPGTMAAVLKLEDTAVEKLCDEIGGIYPVNYNCPEQIVCAGAADKIDALAEAAAECGGRAVKLAVSGAFHCPYMDEASEAMEKYIECVQLREFLFPVYSNTTAQPYSDKSLISKQINHSVRWQETIENMINEGFDTFVEVGAGKTLTGLIKKTNRSVTTISVQGVSDAEAAAEKIKEN